MEQYTYVGEGILKRPTLTTVDELKLKEDILNSFIENGNSIIESHLDSEAKKRGYDSIITARSYAGYENHFQLESQKYVKLSAACWSIGYGIIEELKNGTRVSISDNEFLTLLPTLDTV